MSLTADQLVIAVSDETVKSVAMSGHATLSGTGVLTLADETVTYAKMQHVSATDKILGRYSAGAGDVQEIACTAAARSILDDTTVAAILTTLGAVPAPAVPVQGDILYYNGTGWVALAAGADGKVLTSHGAGTNPTWETP